MFLKDSIASKKVEIFNLITVNLSYLTFTAFGPNHDDQSFYQKYVSNFPAHDYALWAGDWILVLYKKVDTKITRENIIKKRGAK